jgi:hypothetical protein
MAHPVNLAAQAAGVKAGDMPDLTIKEAKIYVRAALDKIMVRIDR